VFAKPLQGNEHGIQPSVTHTLYVRQVCCWLSVETGVIRVSVADSLDRYCGVAHAVDYRVKQTVRRAVALMAVPWTAGVLWYGPTVVFWSVMVGRATADDDSVCRVPFHDHVGYLIASSCVEFAAPFFTVTTINVLIYLNIRRRSRGLVSTTATAQTDTRDQRLCSKPSSRAVSTGREHGPGTLQQGVIMGREHGS